MVLGLCCLQSATDTRMWQTGAPAPPGASQHPWGAPQAATPSPLHPLRRLKNDRSTRIGNSLYYFIVTTARHRAHPHSPPLGTAAISTMRHRTPATAPPGREDALGNPEPPSGGGTPGHEPLGGHKQPRPPLRRGRTAPTPSRPRGPSRPQDGGGPESAERTT